MIADRLRSYVRASVAYVDAKRKLLETWVFAAKHATYGLAVMRIVYGVLVMTFLTIDFRDRYVLWGPGARWGGPPDSEGLPGWFSFLFDARSPALFTAVYVAMGIVAFVFALGWRTRFVTPVLLAFWLGLMDRDLIGDAGDTVVRLMLIYACFADLSARWSLDARRRARETPRPRQAPRGALPSWPGPLLHNAAVVALACQVFVIYVAAGMYKVQGELWQNGTAVYYALHEPDIATWPGVSNLIASSSLTVMIATYMTVFLELSFPLLMLTWPTRVIALVGITFMHLGIGAFMALPFFAMAMLGVDAIFVGDKAFARVESEVKWLGSAVRAQLRSRRENRLHAGAQVSRLSAKRL